MTRDEFEILLGFGITDEGWEKLENMYKATDLDGDTFADLVREGVRKLYKDTTLKAFCCIY